MAFVDSGVACHLLGQDPARLAEPGGAAGPMVENFVLMELARQLTWSDERARLYHYRTKDMAEVDAVLETADGRVVASRSRPPRRCAPRISPVSGTWPARLGPRFVAGYVFYTGQQTLSYGGRLRALPLDALWRLEP